MTHALTNPYEITVNGITCKASPYGSGKFILAADIDLLGDRADDFLVALAGEYNIKVTYQPKTKILDSVTVYSLKEKDESDDVSDEREANGDQDQAVPQGSADKGSRQKGSDGIKPEKGNSAGQEIGEHGKGKA